MSQQRTATDETFEDKLTRLRARIDLLPPEQRPHLRDLADAISRQRRTSEGKGPLVHGS